MNNDLKKIIKKEYIECAKNPAHFMKKYCVIQHPKKGKIKFSLYDYQENMLGEFTSNRYNIILKSVEKTGRLLVVDGDWSSCGIAAEVICSVTEVLSPSIFKSKPIRLTLEDAPAPTSKVLEEDYFISKESIIPKQLKCMNISLSEIFKISIENATFNE